MRTLSLITLSITLLIGCKTQDKIIEAPNMETAETAEDTAMPDETPEEVGPNIKTGEVEIIMGYDMSQTGKPYELQEVTVKDNMLTAIVQYGGGCEEHTFKLVHNGIMAESEPPQISVVLVHDAPDDMCRALPVEIWQYDMAPILELTHGPVVVHIGQGERNFTVTVGGSEPRK